MFYVHGPEKLLVERKVAFEPQEQEEVEGNIEAHKNIHARVGIVMEEEEEEGNNTTEVQCVVLCGDNVDKMAEYNRAVVGRNSTGMVIPHRHEYPLNVLL